MKVVIESKWIYGSQMKGKEIDLSKEMLKYLDEIGIKYKAVETKKAKNEDNAQ